jgi:hypothetical protein
VRNDASSIDARTCNTNTRTHLLHDPGKELRLNLGKNDEFQDGQAQTSLAPRLGLGIFSSGRDETFVERLARRRVARAAPVTPESDRAGPEIVTSKSCSFIPSRQIWFSLPQDIVVDQ